MRAVGVALVLFFLQACERVDKKEEPEPDAPMAIVFVLEGGQQWIGNTSYERDPNLQYSGSLQTVERVVDKLDLSRRVPPGTRLGIVTYADKPIVRLPLSSVTQFHGSSFGTELDYKGQAGNDLAKGVNAGLDELARAKAKAKLLVVISAGFDGDHIGAATPEAKQSLVELTERAAKMNIPIEAILLRAPDYVAVYFSTARVVNGEEGLFVELGAYIDKHALRATR